MAYDKNQHFVSRFHLRNFSSDQKRRRIALFNFDRRRTIVGASIRGQCSRSYWHGSYDPQFEHYVRSLERLAAKTIAACMRDERLCETNLLKMFALFQLGRTPMFAEAATETAQKIRTIAFGRARAQKASPSPKFNIANAVSCTPFLQDLAACLLVNRTSMDFVTTDNPVVLTNWWFRKLYRKRFGPGTGLAQSGLEIYLPLSPRHQLLFYDPNVWTVAGSNEDGTLYVRDEDHIQAINERQALNAHYNVYFARKDPRITSLCMEAADRRPAERMVVRQWVKSTRGGWYVPPSSPEAPAEGADLVISTERTHIDPLRPPYFLSRRSPPRYDEHPSVVGALRDYAWYRIVEDYRCQLKNSVGRCETSIDVFAARHPLIHSVGHWKHKYWEVAGRQASK